MSYWISKLTHCLEQFFLLSELWETKDSVLLMPVLVSGLKKCTLKDQSKSVLAALQFSSSLRGITICWITTFTSFVAFLHLSSHIGLALWMDQCHPSRNNHAVDEAGDHKGKSMGRDPGDGAGVEKWRRPCIDECRCCTLRESGQQGQRKAAPGGRLWLLVWKPLVVFKS